MSPEFDTILTTTNWKQAILCFVCRKPPARLVKEELVVFGEEDIYCRGKHEGVDVRYSATDFRHDDVFVAVRCTP